MDIEFAGFVWEGVFWFLLGPVGLLILFWAVLSEGRSQNVLLAVSAIALLGFAIVAEPLQHRELRFDSSLSDLPVEGLIDRAATEARSQERPVVLYFRADWCSHCEELEERLSVGGVNDLIKSMLLVRVDLTREDEYRAANEILPLASLPALAFIDRKGRLLGPVLTGAEMPRSALLSILRAL